MQKILHSLLSFMLLALLSGCFPFSAAQTVLIIATMPGPTGVDEQGRIELFEYSIGPVSSGKFGNLVSSALSSAEGTPFAEGWAQWTGLKDIKQNSINQSVAAMTDTEIKFLWWHETRERYETLIRLPYSDIYSVELKVSGPGAVIRFCHKNTDIPIGGHTITVDRSTLFGFKKSDSIGDWEKTEQAFLTLNQKIQLSQEQPQNVEC